MDPRFASKIIEAINAIEDRLSRIENKLADMEYQHEQALDLISSQLIRVKNGEKLPNDFILNRRKYLDLSPTRAHSIYNNKETDFIVVDVSHEEYQSEIEFPEAIRIPLEKLHLRHMELPNRATNIMVISEDGTRSILACDTLNDLGFYNVNNISGGYKFWPDVRNKDQNAA